VNKTARIAYGFFAQMVLLLLLYAAAALLGAVKFLSPDDPLFTSLPYNMVGGMANVLLNLAVLTGLLGGGVYMASDLENSAGNERILRYASLGWMILLIVSIAVSLFGFLDGRNMLELPPVLRVIQLILVVLVIYCIVSRGRHLPVLQVWGVGIGISVVGGVLGLVAPNNYVDDRILRALAVGLTINVAYPLAAFGLGYWMMRRFSDEEPMWLDTGTYTVAGLVTLAGVLVTLPPLFQLGTEGIAVTLGNIAVILVPALYLIAAAHCYAPLANRSKNPALSAHWFALSLMCFLLGIGLLGALQAAPGIGQWTVGTRLTDLQSTLALFGAVAMGLGVVNQGAAELYGQNRRITGLTPFWLVAFGAIGGGLALGAAGVVQTYLERVLSVGYLDTQNLLTPLYALWVIGLLLVAAGAGVYALMFWARRPVENVG
jgi:nitric oxide reductase subunit B